VGSHEINVEISAAVWETLGKFWLAKASADSAILGIRTANYWSRAANRLLEHDVVDSEAIVAAVFRTAKDSQDTLELSAPTGADD